MRVAVCSMVLAGCGFTANPTGNSADAADASRDGPDGCASYSKMFDSCTQTPGGSGPIVVTGVSTYNTSTSTLTTPGGVTMPPHLRVDGPGGPIDIVFFDDFTVAPGASLRAYGSRAFMIAASGAVQIDGVLESMGPGAGSRTDAACGDSVGDIGEPGNSGAGGGGGGAFQGRGGAGGKGNGDGTNTAGGPAGSPIALPASPVGGCDGGAGGLAAGGSAVAGDGGGAIIVASRTSITIPATGVINVGGGAGRGGGGNGRGGGGGGSGGMILLEAASVTVAGVLAANGGGGGEGNTNGRAGSPGLASGQPAPGGAGGDGAGGDGAAGSALEVDGRDAEDLQSGGGGGGGGAAGFISIRSPSLVSADGAISPPPTPWP